MPGSDLFKNLLQVANETLLVLSAEDANTVRLIVVSRWSYSEHKHLYCSVSTASVLRGVLKLVRGCYDPKVLKHTINLLSTGSTGVTQTLELVVPLITCAISTLAAYQGIDLTTTDIEALGVFFGCRVKDSIWPMTSRGGLDPRNLS